VDRSLLRALRWRAEDRRELAAAFLGHKIVVYRETLADLAASYGYELPEGGVELSDDVIAALRDEADDHAQIVTDTYNDDVAGFLERNADRPQAEVLADFEAWAGERAEGRSEITAVTEAYGPYTDATLAFFRENGIEPEFEFGGHEGDDPPICPVCQALEAGNPHPLERVLEVGSPHIGCRQSWHPLVDPNDLPDELHLGGVVGGTLGGDPLVNRAGSVEAAVESLSGE
jgi:hypothetical protein